MADQDLKDRIKWLENYRVILSDKPYRMDHIEARQLALRAIDERILALRELIVE